LGGIASKSSKLLNPAAFKYNIDFRATSGLALSLTIFITITISSQGILKVSDRFLGVLFQQIDLWRVNE
jgi:hypothetical protein